MGLALAVGVISPMDIYFDNYRIHVITFGSGFLCLAFQLVQDFMIFLCDRLGGFFFGWLLCMTNGSGIIGGENNHV